MRDISSIKLLAQVGVLLTAFFLAYSEVLSGLVSAWVARDDLSHGFIVPFVSLYFIWTKRKLMEQLPFEPHLVSGGICLLLSGTLLITAIPGGIASAGQMSILLVFPSLVLLLAGPKYLKLLSLPLAYLILMNPLLSDLIAPFRLPFQLLAAYVSAFVLELLGIPISQNYIFLYLPRVTIEIAGACSGLNYTISTFAVAIPLAYTILKTRSNKIILILGGFLIGIIANVVRVIVVALWAYSYPDSNIHGPLHMFQGFSVAVVGFAGLFVLCWILSRRERAVKSTCEDIHTTSSFSQKDIPAQKLFCAWSMAVIVLVCLVLFPYFHKIKAEPLKADLRDFPLQIGDWQGKELSQKPAAVEFMVADSEIFRVYRDSSGKEATVYISYLAGQHSQRKLFNDNLIMGYGQSNDILLRNSDIQARAASVYEGARKNITLYWFDLNGRILINPFKFKIYTAFDSIFSGRSNAALIMIWCDSDYRAASECNVGNLALFADQLYPELSKYLP